MGLYYIMNPNFECSSDIHFTDAAMDPHSTRSQFNRREPKAGPPSRVISEKIVTQDTVKMPPKKKAKTEETCNLLIRRPIATNSRIKQDEIVKRNMFLSFVTNALERKSNVSS
jgi:RNA polymerase I-specific transcription initiation factor RRN3